MTIRHTLAAGLLLSSTVLSTAWGAPPANEDAAGARIFRAANCVACHKWSGTGGGGYGGSAANLRKTALTDELIVTTIRCGHPGGGMPYFQQDAYKTNSCYGLKGEDLSTSTAPPAAEHFLDAAEIQTVSHFVVNHYKGKGDPTHEECVGFFGHETRLCDDLPKGDGTPASVVDTSHHLKIDTGPDANATPKK
jgi:hypothetical protein